MRAMITLIFAALLVLITGLAYWLWTPDLARADLEARYLAPDGEYVVVEGARLHVRDTGPRDAPAIVMLHGLGSSLHTWQDWATRLDDRYRVIRLDLPGHGLTGADPTGDYTIARWMALLLAFLDTRNIDQAALIGNSMGGRLAWTLAAQHHDRISALVLLAPDGFESPGYAYNEAAEVPAMMDLMRFTLPAFMLRPNVEIAYADHSALTADVFRRYHDMMRAPGTRAAMVELMRQVVLTPPEPLLAKIDAPTLLVWGAQDAMIPVTNAQDYLSAIAQAELVTFDGLGHVPHEEAPAVSLEPVAAFLDRHLGATSD